MRLRLEVAGGKAVGRFRAADDAEGDAGGDWQAGGEFDLPAAPADDTPAARVGLTAHTPGADAPAGRRAGFDDFVIGG